MKNIYFLFVLSFQFFATFSSEPANRSATENVKKVLNYLIDIKETGILTGQQNMATDVMKWTHKVVEITGKFPALLGEDFSYGRDACKQRLNIVNASVEQWKRGGLVTISWHQVNPDTWDGSKNEGTFEDCQKTMSEERFNELLLDTTEIHKKYIAHIDTIARYLKILRDSGVVVLWRPYHEMNGNWFWWGAKPDFEHLWKLMYNRFTTFHKLNNLIWVWSPNIGNPISNYYPGDNYVDIVGLDGYTDGQRNWDKNSELQNDIDEILSRSKNRIISFAELGWLPDMNWLETKRPEFVWFLCWWTHITDKNTETEIKQVYDHPHAINRDRVNWNSIP